MMDFLPELLNTFTDLPSIFGKYIQNIPAADLIRKRSQTAWTIEQHIFHVASTQKMLLERMHLLHDTSNPVIKPYFPEQDEESLSGFESIDSAIKHYNELRREQKTVITDSTLEQLNNQGHHAEYSQYNLTSLVHHIVFHEYTHLYRIEELWLTNDAFFRE